MIISEPGLLGLIMGTLAIGNVSKMQSCWEIENEIIQVKNQSEVLFTCLALPSTPLRELQETGVMVARWA